MIVKINKSNFKVVDSKSTKAVISRNVYLTVMISSYYLSTQVIGSRYIYYTKS